MGGHMNRLRHVIGALAMVAFVLVPSAAVAGEPSGRHPDAAAHAELFSLEVDEAARELELQDQIGALQAQLAERFPDAFAGIWISHDPRFRFEIALKGGIGRDAVAAIIPQSLRPFSSISDARHSQAELEQLLRDAKAAASVPVNVSIDPVGNQLVVETLSLDSLMKPAFMEVARKPAVEVREVADLGGPAVDIYGGLDISGCTSGFSVAGTASGVTTTGVTTAGHCSNSKTYQGINLPFVAQKAADAADVQWHTTPGLTDQPKFKVGSGTRNVYGTYAYNEYVYGATLCKQGVVTGYDCGSITSTTFCPNWIQSCNAVFIRITNCPVDMSTPGDSGGPSFFGNRAAGHISGYYSDIFCANDQAIVSRIQFDTQAVGIGVLISLN